MYLLCNVCIIEFYEVLLKSQRIVHCFIYMKVIMNGYIIHLSFFKLRSIGHIRNLHELFEDILHWPKLHHKTINYLEHQISVF